MEKNDDYEKKAETLKALANPVRLCIVKGLLDEGCNVSKIQECLKVPQSTISQHLSKLKYAGILTGVRCGTEICYNIKNEDIRELIRVIFRILK